MWYVVYTTKKAISHSFLYPVHPKDVTLMICLSQTMTYNTLHTLRKFRSLNVLQFICKSFLSYFSFLVYSASARGYHADGHIYKICPLNDHITIYLWWNGLQLYQRYSTTQYYFQTTTGRKDVCHTTQSHRLYLLGLYQQQHCLTIYYWWRGRVSCGSCNGVVVLGTELLHHSVQYLGALGISLEESVGGYAELQPQNILVDVLERE